MRSERDLNAWLLPCTITRGVGGEFWPLATLGMSGVPSSGRIAVGGAGDSESLGTLRRCGVSPAPIFRVHLCRVCRNELTQLLTVDPSARASMKNAASCET